MNTSDVLHKAADLIQERGWTQGTNGWTHSARHTGALCLEGGIQAAMGFDAATPAAMQLTSCPAYQAVEDYLKSGDEGMSWYDPWVFNDAPGRTVEEVIAVLRATAAIEAVKEAAALEAVSV